jgi:Ca2+/Na+ antiporter
MGLYELFLQDPSSRLELHYRKIKSKQFLLSKVRKIITNIYVLLTHHIMGLENLLFVTVILTVLFGQMLLIFLSVNTFEARELCLKLFLCVFFFFFCFGHSRRNNFKRSRKNREHDPNMAVNRGETDTDIVILLLAIAVSTEYSCSLLGNN